MMMKQNLNQDSPLHLADALIDEIANAPTEALLDEAAEDLGSRQALASEFDAVLARALRQSRRKRAAAMVKNLAARASPWLFYKPIWLPVGTLAALAIAVMVYHDRESDRATIIQAVPANLQTTSAEKARAAPPVSTLSDLALAGANGPPSQAAAPVSPQGQADLENAQAPQTAVKTNTPVAVATTHPPAPAPDVVSVEARTAAAPSLAWPVKGRILIRFGERTAALRRPHGQTKTAEGITIAVPEGSDVHAAGDGVVSDIGGNKTSGRSLHIRHDSDLTTGYGHLRRLQVQLGQQVSRGEVIGKAGAAGNAAGPELYFEVRKGTVPVDPLRYLPQDQ